VDRGAINAAWVGVGMAVTIGVSFMLVIPIEFLHGQAQVFEEAVGQRVQLRRPVKGYDGYRVVFGDDDVLEVHKASTSTHTLWMLAIQEIHRCKRRCQK